MFEKCLFMVSVLFLYSILAVSPLHAQLPQIQSGVSYLTSSQNPDGTWGNNASLNETTAVTVAGIETLKILNQTAGTAYASATTWLQSQSPISVDHIVVTLVSDPSLTTTTNSSGSFTLNNIPQGSQQVSLAKSGYASLTLTTNVTAGAFFNVGNVGLSTSPGSGIIMGTIWDADVNAPFSGVQVLVTGTGFYQAVTAADGTYRISGVTPGSVTVTTPYTPKPNYYGAPFTGTLAPGGIMIYSPALSTTRHDIGYDGNNRRGEQREA